MAEFNIALSTLVETLKKAGYEIESNPGAKITPEMYEAVRKAHHKDSVIRKEAESISTTIKEITGKAHKTSP